MNAALNSYIVNFTLEVAAFSIVNEGFDIMKVGLRGPTARWVTCASAALSLVAVACGHEALPYIPYEKPAAVKVDSPGAATGWRTDTAATPQTKPDSLPVLYAHPFTPSQLGYAAENPMHQLRFELSANAVIIGDVHAAWDATWNLEAFGRADWMEPATPTLPIMAGCYGGACVERLEYRRGVLVEWYVNTLHGLAQGFDITARPPGTGLLTIQAGLTGHLHGEVHDVGQTLVLQREGKHAFTLGTVAANDITGRQIPTEVLWVNDRMRVQIDDSAATYPIRIMTMAADCPSSWCGDGDPSTVDICTQQGNVCIRALDMSYEGQPCSFGTYCCPAGFYHPACSEEL